MMRTRLSIAALAATATLAAAPAAPAADIVRSLQSPSGNVQCMLTRLGGVWAARCDVLEHSWSAPARPASCQFDWGSVVGMGRASKSRFRCVSDAVGPGTTLAYGRSKTVGPFRCTSTRANFRCVNAAGHGWRLSRQSYRLF